VGGNPVSIASLQPTWQTQVEQERVLGPAVHIEDGGEAVYTGALSPGCRACKDGAWGCIFVTQRCNLSCSFCYSPHDIPLDYAGSDLGATPEEIEASYGRTRITGVSFSGGEPFLLFDRLRQWVAWAKALRPERYCWVYTNGLLATPQRLRTLAGLGLDEIRFNMAASGYNDSTVLAHLDAAAQALPNVTVEIPAIPADGPLLLDSLDEWARRGARFLNLHELLYEPGTNAATLAGERLPFVTDDGHPSALDPNSRPLTLAVMRHVLERGLPLAVNDCSLQSKLRQIRGRRRMLAALENG
jgi:pyruvate formate-lyase activating enzyme-like uncharacterized protein